MPYIQNSDKDRAEMLKAVGVKNMEELFAPIPSSIRFKGTLDIPSGLSETEMIQDLNQLGAENKPVHNRPSFLGGGMYKHHIPVVIDHLQGRSEFVTAYTPYQPEASQGTLTAFYEFQTMIAQLTGLDVANASMYDGISAVAEAVLMSVAHTGRKKIVYSRGLHPFAVRACKTYSKQLALEFVEAPLKNGTTDWGKLVDDKTACVVAQNPNFLGAIENLAAISDLAHKNGAMAVASCNPTSLALLEAPGEAGIDIAVGDGQPLGVAQQFGGPSFGFFAAKQEFLRKMPGRIVGETVDRNGKRGFTLTFQTREQHIRREKATSNICTNNALFALRGAMYMAAAGPEGLREVATHCLQKAHYAFDQIAKLPGYQPVHGSHFFHEFAFTCPAGTQKTIDALVAANIAGGLPLDKYLPEYKNAILFAVTESNSKTEIDQLVKVLGGVK